MPKRTGTNDKSLIGEESYKAYTSLAAARAMLKFAIFQIERAEPDEFVNLQEEWDMMLRVMQEKIEAAYESNSEINYLSHTFIPKEAHN